MASQIPGQGGTNVGVSPNVGGLLCYVPCCIGVIFSIVVAIVEKQSRFLRFHAFQSLLLFGALFGLSLIVNLLSMVIAVSIGGGASALFSMLTYAVWLASVVILIYMMVKAYGGEETSLPVIGDLARKWA